jgi:hypothetical protein
MRRRLLKFLPVILTALMVQILAPVAACWAASVAGSDPLSSAEICHSSPVSAPGNSDQGGGVLHDGACFICCVLHASASVDPPSVATLMSPYREVGRVVWAHHVLRFYTARTGSNSQARAPPQSA